MAKDVIYFNEYKPEKKRFPWLAVLLVPLIIVVLAIGSRIGIYLFTDVDYFKLINPTLGNFPMFIDSNVDVEKNIFYDQLTKEEKKIYRDLYSGCLKKEASIMIYEQVNYDQVERARKALAACYPEFYCLYYDTTYQQNSFGYTLVEFSNPITEFPEVDELVKTLKKDTEYETALSIHDYIIDNVDYVLNCENSQDYRSALYNKKTVCAGYAALFQILAKECGLECYYIEGKSNSNGVSDGHAWNLVKINEQYYYVDVTWDDSILKYDYFLVGDEVMNKSHELSSQFEYPSASNDLFYQVYKNNGEIVIENLNVTNLENTILYKLETTGIIKMHFYNSNECETMYQHLFNNDGENAKKIISKFLESYSYTYSRINDCIIIEIN